MGVHLNSDKFVRIKNNLYRRKFFWQLKSWLEKSVSFVFWRQIFRLRLGFQEERISAKILWASLPSVLLNIFCAILFVVSIETFNYLSPFNLPIDLDEETLTVFLSTIVTICGVFLGLYFAAVSAVAGSLFMRASEDLQALFIREKKGQQYIRTLVLTTVIGILYLVLRFSGYPVRPLGPILVALLAAYSVILFILLGSRVFYFLHPVEASSTITRDAARAIDNATAKGFRWKNSNFQNYYHGKAGSALSTMRSLIDFGIETIKLSDQQLVTITRYVSGLLRYYVQQKKSIPSNSLWYRTKPQFQNWMLADSTEIILALNTGSSLYPKYIKDQTWFEEDCIDTAFKLLSLFVNKRNWESAQACLEPLVKAAEGFGENFYEDSARLITQKVGSITELISSPNSPKIHGEINSIAFIDSFGRLPIAVLVGFVRYLHDYTVDEMVQSISKIDWLSDSSVYKAALPGALLSTLESTATGVRNEYAIEGTIISPKWYLITISVQQYLFELKKYFDFIKSLHSDYFGKHIGRFNTDDNTDDQILLSANLMQRWLEYANKLATCINIVQKFVVDCEACRKVKDLPWVTIDFDAERELVSGWNKEIQNYLVKLLPKLAEFSQQKKGELPDYFGQAYTIGVEACYQACMDNDQKRFGEVFPSVFSASLTAYDVTRKELKGFTQESQLIFSSEPLEDLLTLSGYAKIYSELYQNPDIWTVCERIWGNFLSQVNAKNVITFIAALLEYRDNFFAIMPRAVIRTNWDLRFKDKLREMNLLSNSFDEYGPFRERGGRAINHPSPLIRVMARGGDFLSVDARSIFLVTYLKTHPEAATVDLKDNRDIAGNIEREVHRTETGNIEDVTDEDI